MKKVNDYILNLINSLYFPPILFLIGTISFILGIQVIGFSIAIFFGCYCLIFQKNTAPLIPVIFCFIISIREADKILSLAVALPLFIPSVISLTFHFIRYKYQWHCGKLFIPLILMSIIAFLGGIGSTYRQYFNDGLPFVLSIGLIPLFLYTLFYITFSEIENFDLKNYFLIIFLTVGICVGIEIISIWNDYILYIVNNGYLKNTEVGWLNVCIGGSFLHLSICVCLYYIIKNVKPILMILVIAFLYFVMITAELDGHLGVELCLLPFLSFLIYFKIPNKNKNRYLYCILTLAIICLIIIILLLTTKEVNEYFQKHFLNDTGRSKIYRDGYVLFESNKLFGGSFGGAYHIDCYLTTTNGCIHSSILEMLYSAGIIGLIFYIYYFTQRIKIFLKNNSDINFCAFIGFIAYQAFASIDTIENNFMTVVITFFILFIEIINKSNPETELPLIKQTILYKDSI